MNVEHSRRDHMCSSWAWPLQANTFQTSQILIFTSGNTKKPKLRGGMVTLEPGSRRTGLKVGSSVSLGIVRRCLPFSITYLNTSMTANIITTTNTSTPPPYSLPSPLLSPLALILHRLSRPGQLNSKTIYPPMVTHLINNLARCRVTSLMCTTMFKNVKECRSPREFRWGAHLPL